MEIIVNAGQSRSVYVLKRYMPPVVEILMKLILLNEADGYARQSAHLMQTRLIEQDAGERASY